MFRRSYLDAIKRSSFCLAAAACGVLAAMSTASAAATHMGTHLSYTVYELPSLGGTFSIGNAINNAGVMAGGSFTAGNANLIATLYPSLNQVLALPGLGGPNSTANINDDAGFIGGYAETSTPNPLGEDSCQDGTFVICEPVVWSGGGINVLPGLGGYSGAVLFGFNNRGLAVGDAETSVHDPTCPAPQVLAVGAAVWNVRTNAVRSLPPFGTDTNGEAFSINGEGHVVGSTGTCANVFPNGIAGTHAVE
jgi:uncharacterized membrane protein